MAATPKPINLPLAKVLKAAKKAFDAGQLSAQGPKPMCAYRDQVGRPCAIGAALSEAAAQRLDLEDHSAIEDLVAKRLVTTDHKAALITLQAAHDEWAHRFSNAAEFEATLNALLATAQ